MLEDHPGKIITAIIVVLIGGVLGTCWGYPKYKVYQQEKEGEAEFAKAEQNRKVKVLEAQAEFDSSKLKAQSEVERAKGVAEANNILADSLKGHEEYLRYLWIDKVAGGGAREIIYVPTEANMPILEARRPMPPMEQP